MISHGMLVAVQLATLGALLFGAWRVHRLERKLKRSIKRAKMVFSNFDF